MRLFLWLLFMFHISNPAAAQEENALPWVPPISQYDIAPSFPGGPDSLNHYLRGNMRFPETEKKNRMEGFVMLAFEVTEKGEIVRVRGINGVPGAPGLMEEAIRLVEAMPRWNPGVKNNKPVRADYQMSINFRLE
jgi:periplasmic protein TonB